MKIRATFLSISIVLVFLALSCSKNNTTEPQQNNNQGNPPQPPTGMTVQPQDTVFLIKWDMDASLTYYIYYQQGTSVNRENGVKIPADGSKLTSPALIPGLQSNTDYTFAMSAKNSYGESALCTPITSKLPFSIKGNWEGISNDTTDKAKYYRIVFNMSLTNSYVTGAGKMYSYQNNTLITKTVNVTGTFNYPDLALTFMEGIDLVAAFTGSIGVTTTNFAGILQVNSGTIPFTIVRK